tara:strand:+ start:539 stop:814 length:276 start_codon:yes stop_codon:yes gene_type:complete
MYGSMEEYIEFSFTQTSKGVGIGYDRSGQAIQPPEGPEFELDSIEFFGFEITRKNLSEHPVFTKMWDAVEEYIYENQVKLIEENTPDPSDW